MLSNLSHNSASSLSRKQKLQMRQLSKPSLVKPNESVMTSGFGQVSQSKNLPIIVIPSQSGPAVKKPKGETPKLNKRFASAKSTNAFGSAKQTKKLTSMKRQDSYTKPVASPSVYKQDIPPSTRA